MHHYIALIFVFQEEFRLIGMVLLQHHVLGCFPLGMQALLVSLWHHVRVLRCLRAAE